MREQKQECGRPPDLDVATMIPSSDFVEQIRREIATHARLDPEQIAPNAHFIRDLGLSSLDVLNVLAFVEKSVEAHFPDDLLAELTTLDKVAEAVGYHIGDRDADS